MASPELPNSSFFATSLDCQAGAQKFYCKKGHNFDPVHIIASLMRPNPTKNSLLLCFYNCCAVASDDPLLKQKLSSTLLLKSERGGPGDKAIQQCIATRSGCIAL